MAKKERKQRLASTWRIRDHRNQRSNASFFNNSINTSMMSLAHCFASNDVLMLNGAMRTTITLADETHEFVAYYARVRGLTLGVAIEDLIRKAQAPAPPTPGIGYSPNGLPRFPLKGTVLMSETGRAAEEDDFE